MTDFEFPDCCPSKEQRSTALEIQEKIKDRFLDYTTGKISRAEYNAESDAASNALGRVVFVCQALVVTHAPTSGPEKTPAPSPSPSPAKSPAPTKPKTVKNRPGFSLADIEKTLSSSSSSLADKLDAKIAASKLLKSGKHEYGANPHLVEEAQFSYQICHIPLKGD